MTQMLAARSRRPTPVLLALALLTLSAAATDAREARTPGRVELAQASPQSPSPAPQASPPATPAAPAATEPVEEPIGNVASVTGIATVIRNRNSLPLKVRDDIYLNDVVQTASKSSLSVTFNDSTTFNLSASAKITIDTYVYEDGGKQNAAIFDVGKGTVAFVAAAVAKTGDMTITTPTATLGIRGTTGVVEVPETAGAATAAASNVNIKLYPDADGRVGRIEVNDRTNGGRLGFLTQPSSGFAIRPGSGGVRYAAVPITLPPQQIARDQGFVRQVHLAQTTGRQIVTEQQDFRRANPGVLNPNRPQRQGQQPQQPRPNAVPPQPRPNGQPVPARPGAPATPNRQGATQPQAPGGAAPARPSGAGQRQPQQGSSAPAAAPRDARTTPGGAPRNGRLPPPGDAPATSPGGAAATPPGAPSTQPGPQTTQPARQGNQPARIDAPALSPPRPGAARPPAAGLRPAPIQRPAAGPRKPPTAKDKERR